MLSALLFWKVEAESFCPSEEKETKYNKHIFVFFVRNPSDLQILPFKHNTHNAIFKHRRKKTNW